MHASTRLQFTPSGPAQAAGLVLRQDEANHYEVRVTGVPRRVELVTRISGASTVVRAVSIPEGDVTLAVDGLPDRYEFAYAVGNAAPEPLGSAPTEPLSSERTGGFTGVFVGMYAAGEDNMPPADFDWFDYAPLGD